MTESLAFGATCNPWDPARTSGGSSGGSGTAVAAGLAPRRSGPTAPGSIRIPAAACGLFGLKPQRDRVPMGGNWNGLSVCGALTRGVRDTALFLDAVKDGGPAYADAARAGRAADRLLGGDAARRDRPARDRAARRRRSRRPSACAASATTSRSATRTTATSRPNVVTRYLEGVNGDAEGMPHPERLARRTRGLAGLGAKIPGPLVRRAPRAGGGRPRAS